MKRNWLGAFSALFAVVLALSSCASGNKGDVVLSSDDFLIFDDIQELEAAVALKDAESILPTGREVKESAQIFSMIDASIQEAGMNKARSPERNSLSYRWKKTAGCLFIQCGRKTRERRCKGFNPRIQTWNHKKSSGAEINRGKRTESSCA